MNSPWRIELFGGLRLRQDSGPVINRFQTRKTAALLAYLAFYRDKIVAREILADLLWPDHDPDAARNSLRVALTSLRRQLEPPGVPAGAVLIADRASVHLNTASFTTDVADFDAAIREERTAPDDPARTALMIRAVDLYRGPLLFGWYEEWIDLEQTRLAEVYSNILRKITTNLTRAGDYERALDYAQRAVSADPLREETNRNLMRLYAVLGQTAAAREQYRRLENLLMKELRAAPSTSTRELMKQISALPAQVVTGPPRPPTPAGASAPSPTSPPRRQESPAGETITEPPVVPLVALMSPASVAGNVPMQFTRFVGRELEIVRLEQMLQPGAGEGQSSPRLVTLIGPGGVGKSRLAVEVAQRMRDHGYGQQVWVVSFADLSDGDEVSGALLSVFRLARQASMSPAEQIVAALRGTPESPIGPVMLVLDHLDQVADVAISWITDLLTNVPNLTILTTSRRRLEVGGEQEVVVGPLTLPGTGFSSHALGAPNFEHSLDLESLASNPSIALFVDRARAVRPDFQITARNAASIRELCRRLDGLPLALELAAAGVRLLSPAQMVERLDQGGTLLASERRDLSARHRSLRAVMDESYRLLSHEAQTFFARLAVFRGGWTLAAAAAVCRVSEPVELLDLLLDHSLVTTVEGSGGVRFRFLETIRQYAESQLTGDDLVNLLSAHAHYFRAYAESAGARLREADDIAGPAAEGIAEDLENLRTAVRRALDVAPTTALRICVALWRFWYARGEVEEGYALLDMAARATDTQQVWESAEASSRLILILIEAWHGAGRLALSAGNVGAACVHFERAAELLPLMAVADTRIAPSFETTLLLDRAIALEALGEFSAAGATYESLVRLHRSRGDRWAEACALSSLGAVLSAAGNLGAATPVYEESARLRRALGDRWGGSVDFATSSGALDAAEAAFAAAVGENEDAESGIAASFLQLGHIASEQGDYSAALPLLRESLAAYRRMGDESGAAITGERMALTALRQGDLATARRSAEDALLLRRTMRDLSGVAEDDEPFAQRILAAIDAVGVGNFTDLT